MTECCHTTKISPPSATVRLLEALATVVALLLALGAVNLLWLLWHLPVTSGQLMRAQVLGAFLFSFGLAMGVIGSTFAITSRTPSRRILCAAITLFGISHMLFGLYVRHAIEAATIHSTPPIVPMFVPMVLWAYSVVLALRAPKAGMPKAAVSETPATTADPSETPAPAETTL